MDKTLLTVKVVMLKGEKGEKGDGVYDDTEVRELIEAETEARGQEYGYISEYLEHIPYVEHEEDGDFVLPTHTINDNQTSNESTWSSRKILEMIYPVGSIYMSVNDVNPSTYYGGTWVAWGSGRVPVGINTDDSDFNTVEKTGGEKTHLLDYSEMPVHGHAQEYWKYPAVNENNATIYSLRVTEGSGTPAHYAPVTESASYWNNVQPANAGGGYAHNNMQPYITCYMWKRTA